MRKNERTETKKPNSGAGSRIKKKRLELDLTQAAFSRLLNISPSYLSAVERGDRNVSSRLCTDLHEITGLSYDYIMTGKDHRDPAYVGAVCEDPKSDTYGKMQVMLGTCSQNEITVIYEMCHTYLCQTRRLNRG